MLHFIDGLWHIYILRSFICTKHPGTMAETVLLLAMKKIGFAVASEVTKQASAQFGKHKLQLTELQGSMGRIKIELHVMHNFLCQMDIRSRGNQVYQGWLEEVRKVVYVMEDMVDEYLHLVGHQSEFGCCFCLKRLFRQLPRSAPSLDRIASMVKEIEKNLVHLSETKDRWVLVTNNGVNSYSSYNIVQGPQDLISISRSLYQDDLVGIEDNKQQLVEWLEDGEPTHSVIVVHGMGGLGKTALASTVYRKAREKFDCDAWISISQTYTREDILRKLIIEIFKDQPTGPSNIAGMDMTSIQEELKSFLERMKYLIILDDVWTPQVYNDLLGALVPNLKGSKIIITTRNADVGHLTFPEMVLEIKRLSVDDSWKLFCKKAFLKRKCPEELKDLSEQIVSKCEGLPLAIVSIGSLLFVRDKTREEWKMIHDQLSWELVNNPRMEHVRNVLHLSYIYLPTNLKSCFLYCSLFPEDYILKRKNLIRLWIAEGFVEKRGGSTMEEVAQGYLKELIHRNMLQLVEKNTFGRIRSFKMHDIVRELAIDLCRRECFGVAYNCKHKCNQPLDEKDERRMVIHGLDKDTNQDILRECHLRSFIALDKRVITAFDKGILPLVVDKYRYMSVLDLSWLPVDNVPDAISDLFNLRHLGLRDSKVRLLPNSIEKLSNLLTLDLYSSKIQELPRGIVKLNRLRHLFADRENDRYGRDLRSRTGVCIPKGLGKLRELQTLQAIEVRDEGTVRRLGELRQMRSIRIFGVKGSHCKVLCESLLQMEFLTNLDIMASDENEVLQLNGLKPLPPNLQKLTLRGRLEQQGMILGAAAAAARGPNHSLYSIHLSWSQLVEDPLPNLSQWSKLTELWLTRAYMGEQLTFLQGWFPSIKKLYLRDMPNLKRLEIHQGTMEGLQQLLLLNLRSMVKVPPGIEFLQPTLNFLGFGEISRNFLAVLCRCSRLSGIRWSYSLR